MSDNRDPFIFRFGSPPYFKACFRGHRHHDPKSTFMELQHCRLRHPDKHEMARQHFLEILRQHKSAWVKTSWQTDYGVEISKIYQHGQEEYLAFMRIDPQGFRSERTTSPTMEIDFHLLIGRVLFTVRRRPKFISKGGRILVPAKSPYSIRCQSADHTSYLVFRVVQRRKRLAVKK